MLAVDAVRWILHQFDLKKKWMASQSLNFSEAERASTMMKLVSLCLRLANP